MQNLWERGQKRRRSISIQSCRVLLSCSKTQLASDRSEKERSGVRRRGKTWKTDKKTRRSAFTKEKTKCATFRETILTLNIDMSIDFSIWAGFLSLFFLYLHPFMCSFIFLFRANRGKKPKNIEDLEPYENVSPRVSRVLGLNPSAYTLQVNR